jgi:hypothetical protein
LSCIHRKQDVLVVAATGARIIAAAAVAIALQATVAVSVVSNQMMCGPLETHEHCLQEAASR